MAATIYRYRTLCSDNITTENIYHYDWLLDTPTLCPHSVTSHTFVDATIIDTISNNTTVLLDDIEGVKGVYRACGYTFDISPGVNTVPQLIGSNTYLYPIRVYSIRITPSADNIGDVVSMKIKNVPVGILTQDVNSGNVLHVSSTTFSNLVVGFDIYLKDDSNVQTYIGECIAIDNVSGTLTLSNTIPLAHVIGNVVMISRNTVSNVKIVTTNTLSFGSDTMGSSFLPAGLVGETYYINNSTNAKQLSIIVDYSY